MKQLSNYMKAIQVLLIISVISFSMPSTLSAQTLNKESGKKAVQIAQKIKENELLISTNEDETIVQDPHQELETLRENFTSQIWSSDKNSINEIVNKYVILAKSHGTQTDIGVGQLLEVFTSEYNDKFTDETFYNTRDVIEPYFKSRDWFVRHQAYTIASLSYPTEANLSVALETAQDGLKQIPEEDNPYRLEAKTSSASTIAYLHTMLLNLELSVDSYSEQIDLGVLRKKPIDGIAIINNLIYVFNAWKDNDTTKNLIDILLAIEETYPAPVKGLTEVRASRIYARLGEFQAALNYADTSVSICEIDAICNIGTTARIIALAGLGRAEDARKAINSLQAKSESKDWRDLTTPTNVYQIEALLAAADGDISASLQFMNQKLDANIQKILSQNSGQTANLLASLHNSKERREERAAALETETKLKQVALDRQQFINRLLIALSVILLGLVIGTMLFARYRSKIAKEMEIAAKKALAGEKSKAEFLAIMSHELRTPLNGILGMADIIARKALTPEIKEKMTVIADCGQDLVDLVENIFDMTLIESGDIHLYPERVNIHQLLLKLTEKWGPLIEDKNIAFTAHIGDEVPEYMDVDKARLSIAVDALLSNAHKFTDKGRVHLHVSASVDNHTGLADLNMIVADTGVGITEDAQSRLFKPFVQADSSMTRHFGGAGLGLAISRGLALMMDGDITVNSRSQRGSEFTLVIKAPRLEAPAKITPKQAPKPLLPKPTFAEVKTAADIKISLAGTRVLIAEDDLGSQTVLRDLLEPLGAHLVFTINGLEGLEALSLNHYDLIITDIRMPTMDGFTFVEHIRQSSTSHHDLPIIALTADVASETNTRCKAAGVDIVLMKPVRPQALYNAIDHVQKKQRQRQTIRNAAS